MSKKTEILNIISSYQKSYNEALNTIKTICSSSEYTEEGKEQKISETLNTLHSLCTACHDTVISLIDTATENMKTEWRNKSTGRLNDTDYQLGLSNTLKMLEMNAIYSEDDIKNIVDTYKDDYNAMSAIRSLVNKNTNGFENANIIALIPNDNREKNISLLNQLKSNVDKYISSSAFPNSFGTETMTALGIEGMSAFVSERLSDDLQLT
ncbi:MAG: hypothetical protein J1E56_06505 [Ruminococcus sp.]|nr:hypothetical protein [Ruminococcus sp.]